MSVLRMRAMVIGFPKSGTTTIHLACRRRKLRSAHWKTPDGYCGQLIYESFQAGRDPLEKLAEYDILSQADVCLPGVANYWPNLDFEVLSAIRQYHPSCVFILNRRDPRRIIRSISRWGTMRRRFTRSEIIGLPKDVGGKDDELQVWIEGHYAACAARFAQDPYFLDLDIESPDAQERLSAVLGVELRWWGVANETEAVQAARRAKQAQVATERASAAANGQPTSVDAG
ncbi:MAG TPA: hypothetical protein VGG69_09010 [Rhizomicrobium sp.]|jgi:hypothetical protein